MIGERHIFLEPGRPPAEVSIIPPAHQSPSTITSREIQIATQGIKFLREQAKLTSNLEVVEINRGVAETSHGYIYFQFQDDDEYWISIHSHSSLSLATGRVTVASNLVPFQERRFFS